MGTGEAENRQGNMENKTYSVSSIGKEQKPEWMETGYLKMKDIEAIPLDQRLNILAHYQSGEYDPVTITGKLVTKQAEDYVTVRLPRQSGKFIRIPIEDFYFPEGSRTALAFLKKKEEMKVYTEPGDEMFTMKGNDIFHNYFDTVNANIRTAMEHKSDEREMGLGSRDNNRAGRTSPPETGKTVKDTAEKMRNAVKEMKQPVKGR